MAAKPDGLPNSQALSPRHRSMRVPAGRYAVVVASIGLTACQPAVLDPQGPVGIAEKMILIGSVVIMLAIVVPTIVATLAFAWWFRASNTRATYWPDLVLFGPPRARSSGPSRSS